MSCLAFHSTPLKEPGTFGHTKFLSQNIYKEQFAVVIAERMLPEVKKILLGRDVIKSGVCVINFQL